MDQKKKKGEVFFTIAFHLTGAQPLNVTKEAVIVNQLDGVREPRTNLISEWTCEWSIHKRTSVSLQKQINIQHFTNPFTLSQTRSIKAKEEQKG